VNIDTVVLDLDGTLVDSVYVHITCWKSAFGDVGVDVASSRIHRAIGMGGDRLVTEVAGPVVEHALGDTVRSFHAQHLDERFHLVSALCGAPELLTALSERGVKVVVASSGDATMTDRLLELVEGSESLLLDRISGSDAEATKPAPDLVEVALRSVDAERGLVVGDAVWDVESAVRAGVPFIGVLTGGISESELREAGAVAVFATPRDLVEGLDDALVAAASAMASATSG
jgi:phosphoglycolate phosphatase-like HAD superfamily hydrolase